MCRSRRRGRRGRRRRLGPAPHRLVRLVERAAQPLPRERRLEHARQLPRHADRLPAARRAARLDRRHPGLRADGQLPVRHGGLPRAPGWPTSPPSSSPTARCPTSSRTCCVATGPGGGAGVTPPRSCPGCSTSAPATPACSRASCPSMRAWVDQIAALAGPDRLWSGGFQFGDWLDPTAPPDEPAEAQADPDVVATAYLARSAELVGRRRGGARRRIDVAAEYAQLAEEVRGGVRARVRHAGGRVLSDARRRTRSPSQWALLPTREQRRAGGRRLADLCPERPASASAPASSARRWSPTH